MLFRSSRFTDLSEDEMIDVFEAKKLEPAEGGEGGGMGSLGSLGMGGASGLPGGMPGEGMPGLDGQPADQAAPPEGAAPEGAEAGAAPEAEMGIPDLKLGESSKKKLDNLLIEHRQQLNEIRRDVATSKLLVDNKDISNGFDNYLAANEFDGLPGKNMRTVDDKLVVESKKAIFDLLVEDKPGNTV